MAGVLESNRPSADHRPRSAKEIDLIPSPRGVRLVPKPDGPRTDDDLSIEVF